MLCARLAVGSLALFAVALLSEAQEVRGLSDSDASAVQSNLQFAGMDPIDTPEAFFSLFTEDVHWSYRGNRVDGMKALRETDWCHTISGENTIEQMEGSGDLAYVLGTYQLSLRCGDQAPVQVEGEFVTIHRRDREGSWRIALYLAGQ